MNRLILIRLIKVIEDVSDNLSPYGKNIIEGILRNTKKLQGRQATNLSIKIDERV